MKYIAWRTCLGRRLVLMSKKKYSKVVFLPIIALGMMTVQKMSGFSFSSEEIQIINDGLLALAVLIGVMSDPHKSE